MRISDWSSDVCSSDLAPTSARGGSTPKNCFARFRRSADRRKRIGLCRVLAVDPLIFELEIAFARRELVEFARGEAARGIADLAFEPLEAADERSEERRVGQECVRPCRSRGSPEY